MSIAGGLSGVTSDAQTMREEEIMGAALRSCPFCGHVGVSFCADQGDKWGRAACLGCGAMGEEVRTDYDTSDDAEWHERAIAAWNRRATDDAAEKAREAAATMLREQAIDGPGDRPETIASMVWAAYQELLAALKEVE